MSQPPGGSPPLWQGQPPQRPQQPEQPEPSSAGAPQQPQQAQQTPVPEQPEQQLVDALGEAADGGDRVIRTDRGKAHGLDKCPKCGSSEIHYQVAAGALVCEYCRFQWNEENAEKAFGLDSPIEQLRGDNVASGALNIEAGKSLVTLKCQGCGAEVVIKTDDTLQARCHWCRQTLSVNHQIPSGAVPDALLPFTLPREQAVTRIQEFVGARRTFANRTFLKEFTPENVNGVYVPYMVVDGNLHTEMHGSGEITTRRWTERRKVGDDNYVTETFYSADQYQVGRAFDLLVNDLTAGSSRQYDMKDQSAATNNILDAVQPYDTREAVAFNPNYLGGFTSEKRDLDIRDLDDVIEGKFLAIAREKARPTIEHYDRGVRWEQEGVAVKGSRWVTMYVPVWLYSYYQRKGDGGYLHYVAVNGRNGKTMGSVPVSHPRIFAASCAVGTVVTAVGTVVAAAAVLSGSF